MDLLSRFAALVALSSLFAACTATVADDPCDGARPSITECAYGAAWAECGGTAGEPAFACYEAGGGCLWFANGCVAQGYTASTCPADGLCCVENFPYPSSSTAIYRSIGLAMQLSEWGTLPWDRARERSIDVTLAALPPATPTVSCTGVVNATMGPCDAEANSGRRYVQGEVFTARVRPSTIAIGFWTLSIEVTRDADATLHAQVCRLQSTDYTPLHCVDSEPACAVSGTLELDAFPTDYDTAATTRLHLSATFADGATIDAQL